MSLSMMKYGMLTVIDKVSRPRRGGRTRIYWTCRCDCGTVLEVNSESVTAGRTASCGCRSEATRFRKTHGHSRANSGAPSETYVSWTRMKDRCMNEKHESYHRYGGRSIRICERWLDSFENFLLDMGERPVGMSLDRINNEGNYEPGNCRWATPKQQAMNRSLI